MYNQVHKWSKDAPWCTYVLEHLDSVAVSSLSNEDLTRLDYRHITNSNLFAGCKLHKTHESQMDVMERKIEHHVKLYTCVVPYPVIQEKCQEVKRVLVADNGCIDLCEKLFHDHTVVKKRQMIEQYFKEQHL